MFLKGPSTSADKLLYVVGSMKIDGRLKLMKMMFFLEHLDVKMDKLLPDTMFSKNEFVVYKYGPFSFDVVRQIQELKESGLITETLGDEGHIVPILTDKGKMRFEEVKKELSTDNIDRVNTIKQRFDKFSGGELATKSLEYLGIKKSDKERYLGVPVSVIVSERS